MRCRRFQGGQSNNYLASPSMMCSFPGDTTIMRHTATMSPGRNVGTTRYLVSSALLAFNLSECSVAFVLAIVRTLAACPAPLSCRNELPAIRSGLSLRKSSPGSLDCDRIPTASERDQKLATGCSWTLAVRRGSQEVLKHELKQLGISSTLPCSFFAFPAESTTSMLRCSHHFMNSSLNGAR